MCSCIGFISPLSLPLLACVQKGGGVCTQAIPLSKDDGMKTKKHVRTGVREAVLTDTM